jgi:hypothetical protein
MLSPTSPITAYAASEATPGDDPEKPFEHIGVSAHDAEVVEDSVDEYLPTR